MRPIAHGIDAVKVARIQASIAAHGDHFLERVFTARERAYAQPRKRAAEHFAARFAAKEAVFKALGTGWRSGIAWTDVEVALLPSGQPTIELHGRAAELARGLHISSWLISLTHTDDLAFASVIAIGPQSS